MGMSIFLTLLFKIIPLYGIIFLGYLAGKNLHVSKETVAKLLIYTIAPAVVFRSMVTMELKPGLLMMPVILFAIAGIICLLFYWLGGFWFKDSTKNIMAFGSASGNTGYFGFPVTIALFGEKYAGIAILCTLGLILFENSLGFYVAARGNFTAEESFKKLFRLPTIYTFFLALILNFAHIQIPDVIMNTLQYFHGAYSVFGMMMIGLGLAAVTRFAFDFKFVSWAFVGKFLIWPAFMLGLLFLDRTFTHFFDPTVSNILILMSITPIAANTVAFASALNVHPEKASVAVFLSTLFALLYIPFVTSFLT